MSNIPLMDQCDRASVVMRLVTGLALWLLLVLMMGCSSQPPPADPTPARSQRDIYLDTLAQDPQAFRSMARRWREQGKAALDSPIPVSLPYLEYQTASPLHWSAAAWKFDLDVNDILEIEVRRGSGTSGGLIVDLLRSKGVGWELVTSLESTDSLVRYRPDAAGNFVVRAQPTLDSLGNLGLGLVRRTVLEFPVKTDSKKAVLSKFGVDRDAGRRQHHGIDIFAPRGTPVLAAHDGLVHRVGQSPKGGLHIWQRSDEGTLYYAHLDSVAVESGDLVVRGEVIGGVGNSGNARTTNPHLHFGLYQRWVGPLDPLPLTGSERIPDPWVDTLPPAPRWLASGEDALSVRRAPDRRELSLGQVASGELVKVLARSGLWTRVVTGSGVHGYVPSRNLEAPNRVSVNTESPAVLYASPVLESAELTRLSAGTRLEERGQFGDFTWVETGEGVVGWLHPLPARNLARAAL